MNLKKFIKNIIIKILNEESNRCTNVTLKAFGICVNDPVISGAGVMQHLQNNGFKIKVMDFDYYKYAKKPLKLFVQDHPTGSYIISTQGHSMALIDGKLHDAANGGLNRKVLYAFEVVQKH